MWGRIILRSAEAEGGLESTTAKAAWLDEAGQDAFTLAAWEAIQRRLTLHGGRVLITTTLYNFGWLKKRLYDRASADPDIAIVHFDSTANPVFPRAEWERQKESLPPWRFNMQFRGRYDRPAGMIYDCYDDRVGRGHVQPRFPIPDAWPRYVGLDFGGVNTAAIFLAGEPGTPRLFAYREYHDGGLTAAGHVRQLLKGEPRRPYVVGGAPSEDQWRQEFKSGGLPVAGPDIAEVELGIERVYGTIRRNELIVFEDLKGLRGELTSYSRKLDEDGQPTDVIDRKKTYHLLDAARYIIGKLRNNSLGRGPEAGGADKHPGRPPGRRGKHRGRA
jgi:hypothetical protein